MMLGSRARPLFPVEGDPGGGAVARFPKAFWFFGGAGFPGDPGGIFIPLSGLNPGSGVMEASVFCQT